MIFVGDTELRTMMGKKEQAYIAIVFGLNCDHGTETFCAVLMLTEIDGLLPSL